MLLYIAMTIKSAFMRLTALSYLKRGFVMSCYRPVKRWLMPKALLRVMQMENSSSPALPLNPALSSLMSVVARAANIPKKKIIGFKCSQGCWLICLKEIGWLRTSDLLQMQIKLFTPTEAIK